MRVLDTIAEVRAARADFSSLGLVPTMGFLHEGHLSLVRRARAECGAVAVTIFINPTQFGPNEDLARYPRDLEADLAKLRAEAVDLVFVPTAAEMYPPAFGTSVDVGRAAEPLEGAARPGHFAGVATVVAKLFNIVEPTRAYFGQKDAQQAVVIRRMARDLDFGVGIVVCPTVREADGLALSSRNVYLSPDQRARAPALYRALTAAALEFGAGQRDGERLRGTMRGVLEQAPGLTIDYVSLADPDTLGELDQAGPVALASLAVRLGQTRLIDNLLLGGVDPRPEP